MSAVEEIMCVVCVSVQKGHSDDGCILASTVCKYDLGRVIYLFWTGQGVTSNAGKYLFRAANVWWRCAQYFINASCG